MDDSFTGFYHKMFQVYYFDLGHGLLKELGVSFILGLIMTALTFYLWWLTAIIIIMAGLSFKKKFSSIVPFIVAIVLAIIVAFLGISMKSETGNDKITDTQIEETAIKEVVEKSVEEITEVEKEPEQTEIKESVEDISNDSKYGDQAVTNTSVGESIHIVYGDYSYLPNNVGGENIAHVMFKTDEDGGYFITIDYYKDPDGKPSDTFNSSSSIRSWL